MAVSTLHPESAPATRGIHIIADEMNNPISALRTLLDAIDDVLHMVAPRPGRSKESIAAEEKILQFLRMARREVDDLEEASETIFKLACETRHTGQGGAA